MGSLAKAAEAADALHEISGRLSTELREGRGDFTRLVALADEIGEQGDVLAAAFYEVDRVLSRLVRGDDPVVPETSVDEPAEEGDQVSAPDEVASELRAIVARLAELERRLEDERPDDAATAETSGGTETGSYAPAQTNGSGGANGAANGSRAHDRLTRAQLYNRAQEADVPGRSRMSKEELAQALRASRRASGS